MCYYPYLHQAIHSLLDSEIYVSISLLVVYVIFSYDLSGNGFLLLCCNIWPSSLGFQVEFIYIYNKVFSI